MYELPKKISLVEYENPDNETYGEFMTAVAKFDAACEDTIKTLIEAVNETDEEKYAAEMRRVATAQTKQRQALERIARHAFATMQPDEAAAIWTTLVQDELKSRKFYLEYINPDANLGVWSADGTTMRAEAYGQGRAKLQDGIKPSSNDFRQHAGVEAIHEITDGELDWFDLSEVSEEDEYAKWVHDEYEEDLTKHIETTMAYKSSRW